MKTKEMHDCKCGCGAQVARDYKQGHDARIPLGASCSRCRKPATLAVGKRPACDSHVADVIRATTTASGRVAVRKLTAAPAKPRPAPRPRRTPAPATDAAA